jgi:hypothetical protein
MANPQECLRYPVCPLEKSFSLDTHPVIFGAIPVHSTAHDMIMEAGKYIEGAFNRQKNNDGMKDITLKGRRNFQFLATLADFVNVVKYCHRKDEKKRAERRRAQLKQAIAKRSNNRKEEAA